MAVKLNRIIHGDCIKELAKLEVGSVDLAFADPPFNIGYDYDEYDDKRTCDDYLGWSKQWISGVIRVLKPDGTFWLAIGDEYAAELKVLATRELGLTCRSWVVWYYTFGVHCKTKFTRSHAHLFHFVKDPKKFTFNDMAVRVPSARQLVYGDKRANPKGRVPDDTWIIPPQGATGELPNDDCRTTQADANILPSDDGAALQDIPPLQGGKEGGPDGNTAGDDGRLEKRAAKKPQRARKSPVPSPDSPTGGPEAARPSGWILRPQDLPDGFTADSDTWFFSRVCGTFKQRTGFHGCQMPEQLLGRIIKACSNEGELVLDPFSGSATTLAVAKKLNRQYLGIELSKDYVTQGGRRLRSIKPGDPLDGPENPLTSVPKTADGTIRTADGKRVRQKEPSTPRKRPDPQQLELGI